MQVLLTGATGFIGSRLSQRLDSAGHAVLPISRQPGAAFDWSDASLARGVERSDAIVNLAGENLFAKRWSPERKQELWSSRVENTRRLARLAARRKPHCFFSASAVGYYGPHGDEELREDAPRGEGFLAELCADWEAATQSATDAGVRTVVGRFGVVLGRGGGALQQMLTPFKLGVGGPLGNGRQWMSWIHVEDLLDLIVFALEEPKARGVYNVTAPHPVTMREFARTLGRVLHRPAFFPVPAPLLRLAVGEVADVLLTGQRVIPYRAMEAGFRFEHPEVEGALASTTGSHR
jgi:uncharacterized protein